MNRLFAVIATTAASFALVALIGRIEHLRIILTDSAAPAGIYRTTAGPLTHGELILACLPPAPAQLGLERGYLIAGDCLSGIEPVAKIVGAVPGDYVDIRPGWVAVNGIRIPNSPTLLRDSDKRPLAHVAWGGRRVPDNEVWLFGFNNRRSWDGRYWGAVPTTNILGMLKPLITW